MQGYLYYFDFIKSNSILNYIIIKYPNRRVAAVILEIKEAKNFKEMSDKCDEPLNQIEEKQYDSELLE